MSSLPRRPKSRKVALKLQTAIKSLQPCLAEPNLMYAPGFTMDPAKTILKVMQDVYQECDVEKGEDEPAPLS